MTGPQKFRKKPVVIEAMRWDGGEESQAAIVTWSRGMVTGWFDGNYYLAVETLEGEMRASKGDWIIKGVEGEFYPCRPDIFAKTHEEVDE